MCADFYIWVAALEHVNIVNVFNTISHDVEMCRRLCMGNNGRSVSLDESGEEENPVEIAKIRHISKLDVHFFSFRTFYYLVCGVKYK